MQTLPRDETTVVAAGKAYRLALDWRGMARVEKRSGRSFRELREAWDQLDVSAICWLTWGLLQRHHAKQFRTFTQAGELIDAIGVSRLLVAIDSLNASTAGEPQARVH